MYYRNQRQVVVEDFVRAETRRVNTRWWRRLFRVKPRTEAEVRVGLEVERDPYGFPNRFSHYQYSYSADIELAESVILAAAGGDPVCLSLEDLERLS